MPTLLQCGDCVELVFDECTDIVISPSAGIDPSTIYWWFLEDQQGNIFKHSVTSTADNTISISPDHLPDGFLTDAIGPVTITIKATESATTGITITFGEVDYDCIQATFKLVAEIIGYYE